jgi:hypothetical protein
MREDPHLRRRRLRFYLGLALDVAGFFCLMALVAPIAFGA